MKIFSFLLLSSSLFAQTTATVTATGGGVSKSITITERAKTVLTAFNCTPLELEPGESTVCSATINQAARASGFQISLTIPTGYSGPALVNVPSGQVVTAPFTITRVTTPTAKFQLLDPRQVGDWAYVDPAPLFSKSVKDGINYNLLVIPDSFTASWKQTVNQVVPRRYGIAFTNQRDPILITNYKGGPGTWFSTDYMKWVPKTITYWTGR